MTYDFTLYLYLPDFSSKNAVWLRLAFPRSLFGKPRESYCKACPMEMDTPV